MSLFDRDYATLEVANKALKELRERHAMICTSFHSQVSKLEAEQAKNLRTIKLLKWSLLLVITLTTATILIR